MVQLPYTTKGQSFDEDGNVVKWARTQYGDRIETQRTTYDDSNQPIQTENEAETTRPGVDGSATVTTVTDSQDLLTGERTHEVGREVQQPHGLGNGNFPVHREAESTTTDAAGQTIDTTREVFDRDAQGNTSQVTSQTDTTGLTTVVTSKFDPAGDGVRVTGTLDADGNLLNQDNEIIGHPDLSAPPFDSSRPFGQGGEGHGPAGRNPDPGESGQTETGGLGRRGHGWRRRLRRDR